MMNLFYPFMFNIILFEEEKKTMTYFKKNMMAFLLVLTILFVQACDDPSDPTFSVSFETNGGPDLETVTGLEKGDVLVLEDLSRTGYIFLGWEDEQENIHFESITIEDDLVLYAAYERIEDVFTYDTRENENYDDEIAITSYTGVARRLKIPETIDEKRVTGIQTEAFKDTPIEELVLPRSALSFGHYAFAFAPNLDTLSFYGDYAAYREDFIPSDTYEDILSAHEDACVLIEKDPLSEYKRFETGCPIHKTLAKTDPIFIPGEDDPYYGYEVVVDLAYYETINMQNSWSAGVFSASTLREIVVPKEMFNVSSSAFLDMEHLEAIIVEEDNTQYRSEDGVLYDKDGKWLYFYPPAKSNLDFTMPMTVENVLSDAFSVSYNPYLENIFVPSEHAHFTSFDGVLYDKDGKTLHVYPSGRRDSSYVVKDTVTTIHDFAFQSATHLEEIILPVGLKEIGARAFRMSSLEHVTIPSSVNRIGSQALYGIDGLKTVVFERELSEENTLTFMGSPFALGHEVTVYVPDNSYDSYLELANFGHMGPDVIRPLSERTT
jgi:hypothetical protein